MGYLVLLTAVVLAVLGDLITLKTAALIFFAWIGLGLLIALGIVFLGLTVTVFGVRLGRRTR